MSLQLNFHDGKLIFENISTYTGSSFQENLLFIEFGKRYCVDADWNPDSLPHGFFFVRVIEDSDWDNPLLELKISKFDKLLDAIQQAIDFTVKFIHDNPNRPIRESALDRNFYK